MKMILCIVQDTDRDSVVDGLNEAGFRLTVLPSTGAYFRRGNSTLMIGVDDDQVDSAIDKVRSLVSDTDDPNVRRATVFVLNVAHFEQL